MVHLVQFSGGAGSWAAAKLLVAQHGTEHVQLLFADTRMEDEDLYRFLIEAASNVGVPLHSIADGRDVWQVYKDKRFLGNSQVDPCSRILKRELCKKWVKTRFTPEQVTIHVGIDWGEQHRLKSVTSAWAPYNIDAPLVHQPSYHKNKILAWLQEEGLKLPRLYSMGFPHNNCGGFCCKAGKAHFLHLLEVMPERYAYHEQKEQELRDFLKKDVTILTEQRQKVEYKLTLRQLREREHRR